MKTTHKLVLLLLAASAAHADEGLPFDVEVVADFDKPWAMTFLPDGRLLVSQMEGSLLVVEQDGGPAVPVSGVPDVDYGGQGGLGEVVLHPEFANNRLIYLSYVESGGGDTRGAAVARATLSLDAKSSALSDVEVIWRQYPKVLGFGHYGHRIAFDDEGYLWISSGERQKFTPAQDMQSNMGKILRLNDDGSVPGDNPFVGYDNEEALVDDEGVYSQVWSLGHRNPLGLAFDPEGQLWVVEMGPAGGDELNAIVRKGNYGYPVVSNGDHYDGREIPDHDTEPRFLQPATWWTPVISPADMIFYGGEAFRDWRGDLLIAGLSAQGIVRVAVDGDQAEEVERYDMGTRIRSINEGPDGAVWVLEDERRGGEGRLLKLTPRL